MRIPVPSHILLCVRNNNSPGTFSHVTKRQLPLLLYNVGRRIQDDDAGARSKTFKAKENPWSAASQSNISPSYEAFLPSESTAFAVVVTYASHEITVVQPLDYTYMRPFYHCITSVKHDVRQGLLKISRYANLCFKITPSPQQCIEPYSKCDLFAQRSLGTILVQSAQRKILGHFLGLHQFYLTIQ